MTIQLSPDATQIAADVSLALNLLRGALRASASLPDGAEREGLAREIQSSCDLIAKEGAAGRRSAVKDMRNHMTIDEVADQLGLSRTRVTDLSR